MPGPASRQPGLERRPEADGPALQALRRTWYRPALVGATVFFTLLPLPSLIANPPEPLPFTLLAGAWALFVLTLVPLFRGSPFGRLGDTRRLAGLAVAITVCGVITEAVYGIGEAGALFFYAGVTAARFVPERWALSGIAAVSVTAAAAAARASGNLEGGLTTGITVGTISVTLSALSALGRANRELHATRRELADLAVDEERSRIARDLHDSLGHSLSVIALKSELARRLLPADTARADAELADVERVAREALASVRETVSGYRQPSLAIELAGARAALAAAGIEGDVEPPPEDLPRDVDVVLGWAVREGVTNVLRHSRANRARIRVVCDGAAWSVEVIDDGRGAGAPGETLPAGRPGIGLTGLRERAARLGGRVEAGPLLGHGFRLLVTVPSAAGAAT
jgi:two-component system sensor histidine kinase DesK